MVGDDTAAFMDDGKPKRQWGKSYCVSLDEQMHGEIAALSDRYSAELGYRVSYRAVVRMALAVWRLHRDRKAARDAR